VLWLHTAHQKRINYSATFRIAIPSRTPHKGKTWC